MEKSPQMQYNYGKPGMQSQVSRAMDPNYSLIKQQYSYSVSDDYGRTEEQIDRTAKRKKIGDKISNVISEIQVGASRAACRIKKGPIKGALTAISMAGKKDNIQDPTQGSHSKGGRGKGSYDKKGLVTEIAFSPCPGGVCKK